MKRIKNIHPGEILSKEFLVPLGITRYRLSKETGIRQTTLSAIVKGKRRITAGTAVRLSVYFNNSARFWLGLQRDYDMKKKMPE